jgi:hypothetical protein
MRKNEFLDILRQSLSGEISPDAIDSNIRYYDQYIGTGSKEEEEKLIDELGDPRLIARTIIEADKIAKEKGKYTGNRNYQYEYYNGQENENQDDQRKSDFGRGFLFKKIKWYHKLALILICILFLVVILIVGQILIRFLFVFGLPILLILLVVAILRRR